MKYHILILLTQLMPTWIGNRLKSMKLLVRGGGRSSVPAFLPDIDHFSWSGGRKDKRALVMLAPVVWITALRQYPNIEFYNHSGFIYGIVKALNENGYVVDLAVASEERKLDRRYDLFLGHGGYCKGFIEQLPVGTPVYQYISGLYWEAFEAESDQRYNRFYTKHGGIRPKSHRRSITPLIEGLEFLNRRADVLFSINAPRMVAAYGPYAKKFYFTGLGAYLDDLFCIPIEEKNFVRGRKNFIYVGGTGGNLQKGLDLLLEAFVKSPDLHLYIYCKVEEEIFTYCGKELGAGNIHYIYHWKYKPFHSRLRKLLKQVNFSVHAPINTGIGTAFSGTMGAGMIPVGYIDLADPGESAVLCDSWDVSTLAECIRQASEKSPEWCSAASLLIKEKYGEFCDPAQVEENTRKMFSELPKLEKAGRQ